VVSGRSSLALPAAAAIELIHNFSLVHDDIQDESPLRRGRPTVWAEHGEATARAAGDYLFARAFAQLAATGDAEGPVLETRPVSVTEQSLLPVLERFRGEIEQVPPMHSALKHAGTPLYRLARRGEEAEIQIDLLVARAVERPHRGLSHAAGGAHLSLIQDKRRRTVAQAGILEHTAPDLLGTAEHLRDELPGFVRRRALRGVLRRRSAAGLLRHVHHRTRVDAQEVGDQRDDDAAHA